MLLWMDRNLESRDYFPSLGEMIRGKSNLKLVNPCFCPANIVGRRSSEKSVSWME
jgi:hypothetical protein